MASAGQSLGCVAYAAVICSKSFKAISAASTSANNSHEAASTRSRNEDSQSRFRIWMSNLGATLSKEDRRSADYRLRDAPEVGDRIVELLEELTELNHEVLEIVSAVRPNRKLADYGSEEECPSEMNTAQDELSDLHLTIGDTITSLMKVSTLIRKATKRDRYARAADAKGDPFIPDYDIRHVEDKWPKLQSQPWLSDRLGRAITQRRQYLRYCRNHRNRMAYVSVPYISPPVASAIVHTTAPSVQG